MLQESTTKTYIIILICMQTFSNCAGDGFPNPMDLKAPSFSPEGASATAAGAFGQQLDLKKASNFKPPSFSPEGAAESAASAAKDFTKKKDDGLPGNPMEIKPPPFTPEGAAESAALAAKDFASKKDNGFPGNPMDFKAPNFTLEGAAEEAKKASETAKGALDKAQEMNPLANVTIPFSPLAAAEEFQKNFNNMLCKALEEFKKFVRNVAEELKKVMVTGVEALGIPKMDPLFIPEFKFDLQDKFFTVGGILKNISIANLSTYTITQLDTNLPQKIDINFSSILPAFSVSGYYDVNGTLLDAMPILGAGQFKVEAANISQHFSIELQFGKEDGGVSIKKFDAGLTVGGVDIEFEDLFGPNNFLPVGFNLSKLEIKLQGILRRNSGNVPNGIMDSLKFDDSKFGMDPKEIDGVIKDADLTGIDVGIPSLFGRKVLPVILKPDKIEVEIQGLLGNKNFLTIVLRRMFKNISFRVYKELEKKMQEDFNKVMQQTINWMLMPFKLPFVLKSLVTGVMEKLHC